MSKTISIDLTDEQVEALEWFCSNHAVPTPDPTDPTKLVLSRPYVTIDDFVSAKLGDALASVLTIRPSAAMLSKLSEIEAAQAELKAMAQPVAIVSQVAKGV